MCSLPFTHMCQRYLDVLNVLIWWMRLRHTLTLGHMAFPGNYLKLKNSNAVNLLLKYFFHRSDHTEQLSKVDLLSSLCLPHYAFFLSIAFTSSNFIVYVYLLIFCSFFPQYLCNSLKVHFFSICYFIPRSYRVSGIS